MSVARAVRGAAALVACGAAAVVVAAAGGGCNSQGSHIYAGRIYDTSRGCLGGTVTLDVVDGADVPDNCSLKCLVAPAADGAPRSVYVSTQCPPYPPLCDTSGALPGCAEAIAAGGRGDLCLVDGGSSSPLPPDAGDAAAD